MPAGGAGVITGVVEFDAGRDTIIIHSGRTGAISQGVEVDRFEMYGGEIVSLQQGDGYDTFLMTGGAITGAFLDGDSARQTGGVIGRVDMKLADNFYYLTGGQILGNLVTGFGVDTIAVSGGQIGGNISTSGGDDVITISGGSVNGEIRASFGNDRFDWTGGAVFDGILLGGDSDVATLSGLDVATLAAAGVIDGGIGAAGGAPAASDLLVFDNTSAANGAQYLNWETVQLDNNSIFELGGAFTLGDTTSGTGRFDIDGSSFLLAQGASTISPALAGQRATLNNAGVIQLSDAGTPAANDTLTVRGDYHGLNGSLLLDTYLGVDGSASDRLLISGGVADGLTGLGITNAGGPGGGTTGSGIMVVGTTAGGTTTPGAFALDRAVAAGAYEYMLFRGGVNAGEAQNWYLRSQLVPVPAPPPAPPPVIVPPAPPAPIVDEGETPEMPVLPPAPIDPAPDPEGPDPDPLVPPPDAPDPVDPPDPGSLAPTPGIDVPAPTPTVPVFDPSSPGGFRVVAPTSRAVAPDASLLLAGAIVPLYRIEAANYAAIQPAAYALAIESLSTFHGRRGEQDFLPNSDARRNAWFRTLGSLDSRGWSGTVAPSFEGVVVGFQAGMDFYADQDANGDTTQAGLFAGYSGMTGDLRGFALGWADYDTGSLNLGAVNLGAYATRTGAGGWYLDGVLMASLYHGDATSTRGVGIGIAGLGLLGSIEAGYPLPLGNGWVFEPQAQLIAQTASFADGRDPFATIGFDASTGLTGRLGARLYNRIPLDGGFIQPELLANLWQNLGEFTVNLDGDPLTTNTNSTALELGAGVTGQLDPGLNYFANASYTFDIAGDDRSSVALKVGLQLKW